MTGAARVECVERNRISPLALQRLTISESHRNNSALGPAPLRCNIEADQIPRLVTRVDFLHHVFNLLWQQLGGYDKVFVWNDVPNVVHRLCAWRNVSLLKRAMHRAIN